MSAALEIERNMLRTTLRDVLAEAEGLRAALARVEALHQPSVWPRHGGPHHGKRVCRECSSKGWADDQPGELWPCPTVAALSPAAEQDGDERP